MTPRWAYMNTGLIEHGCWAFFFRPLIRWILAWAASLTVWFRHLIWRPYTCWILINSDDEWWIMMNKSRRHNSPEKISVHIQYVIVQKPTSKGNIISSARSTSNTSKIGCSMLINDHSRVLNKKPIEHLEHLIKK